MKKLLVTATGIVALSLALIGCSQSPLDALKSDDTNSTYDAQYWKDTAANDPSLFNQAVQYCSQNPTKPNCAPVNSMSVSTNTTTTIQTNTSTPVSASAPVVVNS